jgi:sulfur relay (sulfurtransferase) DsrF/TusC family protein
MNELLFVVEEAPEGGFIAKAAGAAIFTEADTVEELKKMVIDAVRCHFKDDEQPKLIRLHFVKEELLTLAS